MTYAILPDVALLKVFSALDASSLLAAEATCTHWHRVITGTSLLWRDQLLLLDAAEKEDLTKWMEREVGLPKEEWPSADAGLLRETFLGAKTRLARLDENWKRRRGVLLSSIRPRRAALIIAYNADLKGERILVAFGEHQIHLRLYDLVSGRLLLEWLSTLKRSDVFKLRDEFVFFNHTSLIAYLGRRRFEVLSHVDDPVTRLHGRWDLGRRGRFVWTNHVAEGDVRKTFVEYRRVDEWGLVIEANTFSLDPFYTALNTPEGIEFKPLVKVDDEHRLWILISAHDQVTDSFFVCYDLTTGTEWRRFRCFLKQNEMMRRQPLLGKVMILPSYEGTKVLDFTPNPPSLRPLSICQSLETVCYHGYSFRRWRRFVTVNDEHQGMLPVFNGFFSLASLEKAEDYSVELFRFPFVMDGLVRIWEILEADDFRAVIVKHVRGLVSFETWDFFV